MMIPRGATTGQNRVLQIVDEHGHILNERSYRYGIDETNKIMLEMERLLNGWNASGTPMGDLRIVDVPHPDWR